MSAKIKREEKTQYPPIEETWENNKQVFINTCEVNVENAKRIDNLLNIRDLAYKFWGDMLDKQYDGEERIEYFKTLQDLSIRTYQKILDIIKTFELEEFLKEDMKDYFEDLMPKVDDVTIEEDLLEGMLIFLSVKPYGERMMQLHYTMMNEAEQREQ